MTVRLLQLFRRQRHVDAALGEVSLEGELYSVERLELYARSLAAEHKLFPRPARGHDLLARLEENEKVLIHAYRYLAEAVRAERSISPAAEWLVDNFHIVEEQLREIREDLPESYYRELPKLSEGRLAHYPRIYAIALEIVAHTDSRLELETLKRFIRAYQREKALSIGELWAVAITLRLALVENLRRIAGGIVDSRQQRTEANKLADALIEHGDLGSAQVLSLLTAQVAGDLEPAFIVQFFQRLHDQDPAISAPAIGWLESNLARKGLTTEQVVQLEHQRQAGTQITVANIITSMRLLSTIDWGDFFESVSLIDPLLGSDPAGAYTLMDFATRDSYRHVIERLGKRTGVDELEVGRKTLELAEQAPEGTAQSHIGFYLIDQGLSQIEAALGFRRRIDEQFVYLIKRYPTLFYVGSIIILASLIISFVAMGADAAGATRLLIAVVAVLSLIPASDLATSIVNFAVSLVVKPNPLPKMNTRLGISEPERTFVVIPTMLTDVEYVQELLEKLEVHYLANQDDQIFFALLTDYLDAPNSWMPDDEILLETVTSGIAELNSRYNTDGQLARFHLFHRRRQWNQSEGKWIGWERKRGKLNEFNRLMRGATDTSFIVSTATATLLSAIRYVITLDSDTQLPHGTARRLVGTISHPLNRPCFDKEVGRVTRGYGILQPRISISLVSASRSFFASTFAGNTGVDPYTTTVSNVYQDLFGTGIYTGKGIYEVDAFEAALSGRVPENSLLSHDLFEGLYARAALVTDIELFDDYPERYDVYAYRQHRWARGDWQVAPWILPHAKDETGKKIRNPLPLISRWQILDNLRRSLVAPAVIIWLTAAWTILPDLPLLWTTFILLTLTFPVYAHAMTGLLIHQRGVPWTNHFLSVWGDLKSNTLQAVLNIAFTAHQACLMTDAIVRTLYRKLISGRHLLEWVTAAQNDRTAPGGLNRFVRFMWAAPGICLIVAILVIWLRPESMLVAAPFLLVWISSPLIAYLISQPRTSKIRVLGAADLTRCRLVARRTWRFFETFVGEQDHWLPPDNYQEDPQPVIAHRTSPTNIGLLFLSTVAVHDLGYIGTLEFVERLELTFTTLEKLPRFRGHFFNWYHTYSLEPLAPEYVSTVDSGNLAGHLIVVKQACAELADKPLFGKQIIDGLNDAMRLMSKEVDSFDSRMQHNDVVTIRQLRHEIEGCMSLLAGATPTTLSEWSRFLSAATINLTTIQDIVNALLPGEAGDRFIELRFWIGAAAHQLRERVRDLRTLTPWVDTVTEIVPSVDRHPNSAWSELKRIVAVLDRVPVASEIAELCDEVLLQLAALCSPTDGSDQPEVENTEYFMAILETLTLKMEKSAEAIKTLDMRALSLSRLCQRFLTEMDFGFLYDKKLKVLTIGYNVSDHRRDESFYDLLASEARLASFIAIATNDVPYEHWFRLGRQLTSVNGRRALLSWSATMFEYLMPLLVMRNYEGTLLDETYQTVVARQIEYGRTHGVPWGISESAYNARDVDLTYQYAPFGVPGMGLKRGLSENLVVSPYATLLAAILVPDAAVRNLKALEREGALGRLGFYEAIDYTPERLPPNQRKAVIHAYMTHHQGMNLVALDNLLNSNVMQNRFHSDSLIVANELLLQERVPHGEHTVRPRAEEVLSGRKARTLPTPVVTRHYTKADLPAPRTQLLSNGTYSVMVTTAGAGYSMYGTKAVTRWREDATRDNWGSFCYLRDLSSGAVWSTGYQPVTRTPQSYEVSFSESKVSLSRQDVGLSTYTEIIVSAQDNAELRRVSITNHSSRTREIEVTSYAEVVLAPQASDEAHQAFGNLFVETEFIAEDNALLAHRRPRLEKEEELWGVHTVVTQGEVISALQYETDRSRFLGRYHSPADPVSIMEDRLLSNSHGAVLDPIFSLRQRVRIKPNATVRICFSTAVSQSREEALKLADKYHDPGTFEREAMLAWTKSQVEMRHLRINMEDAQLFQRLAGLVVYLNPSLRPRPHVLALNSRTQSALWPYGISGDLPIMLVRISDVRDLRIVAEMLSAHQYLRAKGLLTDLIILNDHPTGYAQSLHDELNELVRKAGSQQLLDKPGGVFIRRSDSMSEADRILLHTVARVCIVTERGSLEEHLSRPEPERELPAPFIPSRSSHVHLEQTVPPSNLTFFNGLGGFSEAGHEYVTILGEGQSAPAPWLNVIANGADFGFQISESGASFTWSANSHENRLTSWSNDAVTDASPEVIYLRDEDTGAIWTPTPQPIRQPTPYVIRHGQGYSIFEHTSHGIEHELLTFVPVDAAVKITRLRLHNKTDHIRRVSVTSYTEPVLGVQRSASAPFITTEVDQTTGAVLARNPYNKEFSQRIAFVEMSESERTFTCDRKEFLGRNGSTTRPAALGRNKLSGAVGTGFDPCIALQAAIELAPGEQREVVILLGEAETMAEARIIITRYRRIAAVREALEKVRGYWDEMLGAIEVRTPDAAMDIMMNRWLLYQALSCRIWARSAFYQSSGAYGFRDQLQDVMALAYSRPEITRAHLLRAASRQFKEGDVQHWWHPPTGWGVRTRLSDDPLWLVYVTNHYLNATGDLDVLNQEVPFLEAPILLPAEIESAGQPSSGRTANLFEHCTRALDHALATGIHGLPLMGTGDWNDGMNRVGFKGQGESVWLGWFQYKTLGDFAKFCDGRGELNRSQRYRDHMVKLKRALEDNAWDGDWYLRAFFDDGTPLGSAKNDECRIDSIAQTWGIISGAADPLRATHAMSAVEQNLILPGEGLVLLFTPPFDKGALDPGYIKAYVPGVRENGGQYTHAAIWTVIAYAMLGDGNRAGELFTLLNPINHASNRAGLHRYKVEPYVAAADIYAVAPHDGRGGWTWYTGAAGWMYRAGLESILGFKMHEGRLVLEPCIPRAWTEYEMWYRKGRAIYHIKVENPHGASRGIMSIMLDGNLLPENYEIRLVDDEQQNEILVVLGNRTVTDGTVVTATAQESA